MRRFALPALLAPALLAGCATHRVSQGTLGDLHKVRPDTQEVTVEGGLEQAMESYRRFLEETPETAMTPEAIRRLADLQLEKQFGIRAGDGKPPAMAAPKPGQAPKSSRKDMPNLAAEIARAGKRESDRDFERRTTAEGGILPDSGTSGASALPAGIDPSGPLEAIALYEKLLREYPSYQNSDQVLYQMARAYDELGRTEEAMEVMERLIRANPNSAHMDEVQFRRGEFYFTRRKFRDAENAYSAVTRLGTGSSYYELALYKLGWTFYKQDLYEEALQQYMALLDYKVSIGFNFDEAHDEEDDRRVADTFRVISLSFSNLGGPEAIQKYFSTAGSRTYEDRVYSNLGEHYLAKLRYDDAAKTYRTFVELNPFHRSAPRFSMRVVETFTQGGFPKLVLEAKREFATRYSVKSEYWKHNKIEEAPEVQAYVKSNLKDLATHYHAQYQGEQKADEKLANYGEALHWYGEYLESFPTDAEAPSINYRLADLHLENKDFGEAAKQYQRTAYGYPAHSQAAAAGYAAVFSYREQLKVADEKVKDQVKRDVVTSSLKFVDTFPDNEKAAPVLGGAADDLFEMKDYPPAVATAQRIIDKYPAAETGIRRSAWIVVAHGSFELAQYPQAEKAYAQVLMATPKDDKSHAGFVDNLAASIYKQGEIANEKQDYRAAADHFLRIRAAAPDSSIRPAAEFDAGAALIRLQDWTKAAEVLEGFRKAYPDHKLQLEATKQIAHAYRESGQLARAAGEYERLGSTSEDPTLRSESLLVAGDLYEQSHAPERALEVYQRYVSEFPAPIETALETRFKIAGIHKAASHQALYKQELSEIVRLDAQAGKERTARTRTLAGRSALVLAEQVYGDFVAVKLRQPFEASLQEKKQRMDATIETMDGLVAYEIGEVTAAATFYMAETYFDFSRSLTESERPTDLSAGDLQEYEQALDEEAFPFEEKAIKLHEKNLELLRAGVACTWTDKSLGRLAELMPGRYAKQEISSGLLNGIDTYIYRHPIQPAPPATPGAPGAAAPPADQAPETQPAPAPAEDGGAKHD
jgi:tetratricopeptide (TPR) repeat protein